jgi:TRAP transporter TAXI family solute receptor
MLGVKRQWLLAGMLATLSIAAATWLAVGHFIPAPPSGITIAAGAKGGAFEYYADRYREILARSHVTLNVRSTGGTSENLKLLQEPDSVIQVAFVQGGVSNSSQARSLESLGRVNYLVFFIFYRANETLTDLTQLKGKRVAIGPLASGTRVVAEKVLKVSGITSDNATFLPLAGRDAVDALDDGRADVLFLGSVLEAPVIQSLLRDPGVKLLSLSRAKALTRKFPFLYRLDMPRGVVDFARDIPDNDVALIATTYSVLVRDDIHPEIVELLARALVEVHGEAGVFQQFGEFPAQSDPEYPMAESARDFYKNGSSFLQRYLPFWLASYVRRFLAILITVLAIVVPVFSYGPKIYLWILSRHITRLYRDLRLLDGHLRPGISAAKLQEHRSELERIDRAAGVLPLRHSDLFFELKTQIAFTRTRLDLAVAMADGKVQSVLPARVVRASTVAGI